MKKLLTDIVIDVLRDVAKSSADQAISRSETIQRVIKTVGLSDDPPRDDFEAIYIHTLIEYGVNRPEPVLRMWRQDQIKEAFRKSFEQDNIQVLVGEIETIVSIQEETEFLGKIDYNLLLEMESFASQFARVLDRIRTPQDVRVDHRLDDLSHQLTGLAERFDGIQDEPAPALSPTLPISLLLHDLQALLPAHFIPRPSYTDGIRQAFGLLVSENDQKPVYQVVILAGIGGTGKSTIVRSLALLEDIRETFKSGILWVELGDKSLTTNDHLRGMLFDLQLPRTEAPDRLSMVRLLKHELSNHPRLLILDDAQDSLACLEILQCLPSNCKALITTRDLTLHSRLQIGREIIVEGFEPQEARKLIASHLEHDLEDTTWNETIKPIMEKIGFHPLAITLASSQVASLQIDWSDISVAFEIGKLGERIDFSDPATSNESLDLSFRHTFEKFNPVLRHQMQWLSVLALGKPFLIPDAAMILSGTPEQAKDAKMIDGPWGPEADPDWINEQKSLAVDVLSSLVSHGIIQKIEIKDEVYLYKFHPLIQTVVLNDLRDSGGLEKAILHHGVVYFSMTLTDISRSVSEHSYTLSRDQIIELLERSWSQLHQGPHIPLGSSELSIAAIIGMTIKLADHWNVIGEYDQAIKWITRALDLAIDKQDVSAQHSLRTNLARLHFYLHDYSQAEYHSGHAFRLAQSLDDPLSKIVSKVNACLPSLATDRAEDIVPFLEEQLNEARELGDEGTIGYVAGTLVNAYIHNNKFDKAVPIAEEAIRLAAKLGDQFSYGMRIGNLGVVLSERARRDILRAIALLNSSRLTAMETGNNRSQANHLINLASLYKLLGDHEMATTCLDQAKPIIEVLDPNRISAIDEAKEFFQDDTRTVAIAIEWVDLFYHAKAAIEGDRVSELRLRRYISQVKVKELPPPYPKEFLDRIELILDGERDPIVILRDMDQYGVPNLHLLAVDFLFPGIHKFLIPLAFFLTNAMMGKQEALNQVAQLQESIRKQSPIPDEGPGLSHLIRGVLNGDTNTTYLVSAVKNHVLRSTIKLLLSYGPPKLDVPPHILPSDYSES